MPVRADLLAIAVANLLALSVAAGSPATAAAVGDILLHPELVRWEKNMIEFGRKYAAEIAARKDEPDVRDLVETVAYYDPARVYQQIGEYTRDAAWKQAVLDSIHVYRDRFVVPAAHDIDGHLMFTHGLLMHHLATDDAASRDAVLQLAAKERWSKEDSPIPTESPGCSRENAYAIMALINSQRLGGPVSKRLPKLVDNALGHFDQWFVSRTETSMRCFMVGLEAEALIEWHAETKDPRIVPALEAGMDGLWELCWLPDAKAFRYTLTPSRVSEDDVPAPDLNLMIAPAYAWLWHQTGDAKWLERGDQVFAGGVTGAYLVSGKHFDQNYRWSFDYVRWRSQPPIPWQRALAREAKKKKDAAPKPAKPKEPPPETGPSREAVARALREGGLPTSMQLTVFGERAEAEVLAADEAGLAVRTRTGGELHLPWSQVADADLARLAFRVRADDTAALAAAWKLAGAVREGKLRDDIGYRLLELDPETFRALAGGG